MFEKLNSYVKEYKPRVRNSLSNFFDSKIAYFNTLNEKSSYIELLNSLKDITCDSGKMFRPLIALCFFQMLCQKEPDIEEIKAISTLELIHKFLLIHDDIADNDKQRYSKLNLYGLYGKKAFEKFSVTEDICDRYGLSVSMIAGDLNHDFVYEILNKCEIKKEVKNTLIVEIQRIISLASFGWKEEYDFTYKKLSEVSEEELLNNLEFITSAYTTEGPARFGGLLTGSVNEKTLKLISAITIPLGKAFQITDDLHGTFNEESGQSIKSDISEGKKTLHIIHAYNTSSENDKKFLKASIGNKKISPRDFEKVREIIERTGAKKYAEEKAMELKNESLLALEKLPFENKYKEILKELCEFAVMREF